MSPIGTTRTSDDVRSALAIGGIVLQNYFELPSEEIFFKIAHRCGILIQETARSDSYSCPISLDPLLAGEFCE